MLLLLCNPFLDHQKVWKEIFLLPPYPEQQGHAGQVSFDQEHRSWRHSPVSNFCLEGVVHWGIISIVPEREEKEIFFFQDKMEDDVGFPTLTTLNSTFPLGEEEEVEPAPVHARFPKRWQDLNGTDLCGWTSMEDGVVVRISANKPGVTKLLPGLSRMAALNR